MTDPATIANTALMKALEPQPIETAPIAGSGIEALVWDPEALQWTFAFYATASDAWWEGYDNEIKPTHWLPVPPPITEPTP